MRSSASAGTRDRRRAGGGSGGGVVGSLRAKPADPPSSSAAPGKDKEDEEQKKSSGSSGEDEKLRRRRRHPRRSAAGGGRQNTLIKQAVEAWADESLDLRRFQGKRVSALKGGTAVFFFCAPQHVYFWEPIHTPRVNSTGMCADAVRC